MEDLAIGVGKCPSLVQRNVMTSNNAQESTVEINQPNPIQGPPYPVIAEPVCNLRLLRVTALKYWRNQDIEREVRY